MVIKFEGQMPDKNVNSVVSLQLYKVYAYNPILDEFMFVDIMQSRDKNELVFNPDCYVSEHGLLRLGQSFKTSEFLDVGSLS